MNWRVVTVGLVLVGLLVVPLAGTAGAQPSYDEVKKEAIDKVVGLAPLLTRGGAAQELDASAGLVAADTKTRFTRHGEVIRETVVVPFEYGIVGATTSRPYTGTVGVSVSRVGQASGTHWSDAFYIYIGSLFWDDFSVHGDRASQPGYRPSCGNTHSPPNTTDEYAYSSTEYRENNCETWHPDDSLTTYFNANCEQWGCTDVGFYKWFMQNVPGYDNGIVYEGRRMRNWWEAMYDFNRFIDGGLKDILLHQ